MVHIDEGEEVLIDINPSIKPAAAKTLIGILLFAPGLYYYLNDQVNYVTYFLYFAGVIILFLGISEIIRARRTRYIVTNLRALMEYRSPIKLEINEIPISKIRGIETRRDFWENRFGLGHIILASGSGRTFRINFQNIANAEKQAEKVRKLID